MEWISAYEEGKRKFLPVRTVEGYVGVEVQSCVQLIGQLNGPVVLDPREGILLLVEEVEFWK
jgi:hypothetical protein